MITGKLDPLILKMFQKLTHLHFVICRYQPSLGDKFTHPESPHLAKLPELTNLELCHQRRYQGGKRWQTSQKDFMAAAFPIANRDEK